MTIITTNIILIWKDNDNLILNDDIGEINNDV